MALGADKGCKTRNGRQPRPVVCLETGEEYESVKAAAEALGRGESSIRASISRGVGGAGYHWAYRTDPKLECKLTRYRGGECNLRRGPCARPVICLETGEEFESVPAASSAASVSKENIYCAIRSGRRRGGYHWAYADDQDIADKLERYFGGESRVQAVTSIKSAPYTVTGAVSDLAQNTVDGSLRGKQANEGLMQDFSIKAARAARDKRQKVPACAGLRDQGIKQ